MLLVNKDPSSASPVVLPVPPPDDVLQNLPAPTPTSQPPAAASQVNGDACSCGNTLLMLCLTVFFGDKYRNNTSESEVLRKPLQTSSEKLIKPSFPSYYLEVLVIYLQLSFVADLVTNSQEIATENWTIQMNDTKANPSQSSTRALNTSTQSLLSCLHPFFFRLPDSQSSSSCCV